MRIASNRYRTVMNFALDELKDLYPVEEIKAQLYYLFEEFLHVKRSDFLLNPGKSMSESDLLKFNFAIKDLKNGKPLQHILGYTYFYGLKFLVNPSTLIPRPETEELVQLIIKNENSSISLNILDLGTGTACIPVSLAKAMPQHQYAALDFSEEIISLATQNAQFHDVDISFEIKNILELEQKDLAIYDVMVSNPPYVLESEKEKMHSNVLDYEPSSALYVVDEQALLFYKKIAQLASTNLKKGGRLYFEINETKGEEISALLLNMGFEKIKIYRDIHDRNRFIEAKLPIF